MKYRQLVARLRAIEPGISSLHSADVDVSGVTHDSRRVMPGFVFAALSGSRADGEAFVADAVSKGAVAVLVSKRLELKVPQIVCANPRRVMGVLSALVAGQPSQSMTVMGVTGTSGKTTSAYLLRHIFSHTGLPCALVGTVEVDTLSRIIPADMTTPEAPDLQAWLSEARTAGAQAVAMEVSSHALCQERLTGTRFAAGLFTNLSQDHLDYHKTMDEYFEAKTRLFRELPRESVAVSNLDDPRGAQMLALTRARRVGFGFGDNADVRCLAFSMDVTGMSFMLARRGESKATRFESLLTGKFNAYNILGAAAVAIELGVPVESVAEAVRSFRGAPGRLERVANDSRIPAPSVFVDYAHKPDALEKVCATLRQVCGGRKLVTVFGCGGDRDRGKRPIMAEIAERLSDVVVVTSDNPRTENADAIIAEVLTGLRMPVNQARNAAGTVIVEADRAAAIRKGIAAAGPGGVVLIAGKGHEDYQIIGREKRHFDDREQAREALAELGERVHA